MAHHGLAQVALVLLEQNFASVAIEAMLPPNTVPLSLMLAASGACSRSTRPSQPAERMPIAATGGMAW